MGKAVKKATDMGESDRQKQIERKYSARNLADRDLARHIADAIAVTRTAVEQTTDEDPGGLEGALHLIWYKLAQAQKAHDLLTCLTPKLAQHKRPERNSVR